MGGGGTAVWNVPVFGSHVSILPSSCLNLSEHMKKRHRQKTMSTIAVTLSATGFSDASPMFCVPAMGHLAMFGQTSENDDSQSRALAEAENAHDIFPRDGG